MSSPVHFSGAATSYGQFINVDDVKVSGSFALIMAVYQEEGEHYVPVLDYHTGSDLATHIWIKLGKLFVQIRYTSCLKQDMLSNAILNRNQWYTLALSFDYASGMTSMWVDGELEQQQTDPCNTDYLPPASAFINNRYAQCITSWRTDMKNTSVRSSVFLCLFSSVL